MMQSQPDGRLADAPVAQFLAALAAGTAAPGGGAATALAAGLGAALAGMVARLTLDRPRYATVDGIMRAYAEQAGELRQQLTALIDADADAFQQLTDARRLPKNTSEEQAARTEAIGRAREDTIQIPLRVTRLCLDVLGLTPVLARSGNRNAVEDAAVGALLAHAAMAGAARNARANLRSLPTDPANIAHAQSVQASLDAWLAEGDRLLADTLAAADARVDA